MKHLHALRQAATSAKAEQPTLEACLGTAALALSLVMAGSGNLRCLRLLRLLRRRVDADVTYGFHMAIGMAIGFLFLGGGRLTLGTSKPAIAALLAALFPRFPHDPRDCRYHLQAFRHLYVLAAEARCVDAVDVDTGCAVLVPLKVQLHQHQPLAAAAEGASPLHEPFQDGGSEGAAYDAAQPPLEKLTPCPLPPINAIRALTVSGPRYWSRDLDVTSDAWHAAGLRRRVLWVKRKIGHLAYLADPQGLSSMFCRHFPAGMGTPVPQPSGRPATFATRYVAAFSSEPMMLAFSQHLCHADGLAPASPPPPLAPTASNSPTRVEAVEAATATATATAADGGGGGGGGAALADVRSYCEAVLYECLAHEKAEVLPSYLRLYHLSTTLRQLTSSLPVHSLRLLSAYYSSPTLAALQSVCGNDGHAHNGEMAAPMTCAEPLLQPTFLHSLWAQLDALFTSLGFDRQLSRHVADPAAAAGATALASMSAEQLQVLYAAFLTFHAIPPAHLVAPTSAASAELLPFIAASLAASGATGGGERGLHATALRIAALGAASSPWTAR